MTATWHDLAILALAVACWATLFFFTPLTGRDVEDVRAANKGDA